MENFDLELFDSQKNLFIQASAGTGKTYTIQLMVSKLISQGTPLKRILIVTFTEKAAGELKDRIRKKIQEVLHNGYIDPNHKEKVLDMSTLELFKKAAQDVDNAAIFTIHSFCQKTLKEYAYDAGRPFSMAMIGDDQVEGLIQKLIRDNWVKNDLFLKLLEKKETSTLIEKLSSYFRNGMNAYKGKMGDKELIAIPEYLRPKFDDYIPTREEIEKIVEAEGIEKMKLIPEFKSNLDILEKNQNKLFDARQKTEKIDRAKNGKSVADLLNVLNDWKGGNNALFNSNTFGNILVNAPNQELQDALQYFYDRKDYCKEFVANAVKYFSDVDLIEFVHSQIPVLFNEWQKLKSDSKCQSFNDMILSVHKAITDGENVNLKIRLRSQYQYAIIDEFQDTNQLQWDIFSTLFREDCGIPVEGHSIFVVGDPKQAIYSFQGADINVYTKAITEIKNGMSLENNFRSTAGIINACNALFREDFFKPNDEGKSQVSFQDSHAPEKALKSPELASGETLTPFWISEDSISSEHFANTVVQKIIEWCSYEGDKTVLQIYDKEHREKPRNVTFKDFAVLARSRSEMDPIEDAFRHAGIPFSRYKDNNLFNSRECAEWTALFKALDAPDFSAWNRRILSEVLITDFFRRTFHKDQREADEMAWLHHVESKIFDDPENKERKQLNRWRQLALKRRYAEMLEAIYSDTQIEQHLMDVSRLQNLSRLRQIGNYAVDYLYRHNCSLDDLVRHLEGLTQDRENTDDENGNLVEKGTDYDAVQVMTIHASKGLEFPVVISFAGFKQYYNQTDGPYLFHSETDELNLSMGAEAKALRKKEGLEEWKRLFYVDFTRASSILMLPRYNEWIDKSGKTKEDFKFLKESLDRFCNNPENRQFYTVLPTVENVNYKELVKKVKTEILAHANKLNGEGENFSPENLQDEIRKQMNEQREAMSELQREIPGKCIMQYSYSTLTGKGRTEVAESDGNRLDSAEEGSQAAPETTQGISIRSIDELARNCTPDANGDCTTHLDEVQKKYPRGSKIGNVLHHIFERLHFEEFGKACPTQKDALENSQIINCVQEEFQREGLPFGKNRENWYNLTVHYLWNTMNALLPEIAGSAPTNAAPFQLISLPLNSHKAEVQFNLNASAHHLSRFCKGFMDLMFVRKDSSGHTRYSILDWKSDVLEDNDYCPANLKEKVDREYSVQRVLYSYCLIQWLKQFYGTGTAENLDEEQIFEKYFGGIYYIFVRGTQANTGKGIYAQTWNSYKDLEAAFENVKKLMTASSKSEVK
ncbi:MAG: UvrD-helicase domain-containing protein [Fibrobacter sp.]|nr:UvrD-helicase domain-containing protein [Fibrobacter sp.]